MNPSRPLSSAPPGLMFAVRPLQGRCSNAVRSLLLSCSPCLRVEVPDRRASESYINPVAYGGDGVYELVW